MFKEYFEVRNNEVDLQGVVNNGNYFNFMAHARHKFLHKIGINFADMAANNQLLLLISTQLEFKKPLKANDKFYVTCKLIPEGKIRLGFEQEVRLLETDELMVKGINTGVCMDGNRKRPYIPDLIKAILEQNTLSS